MPLRILIALALCALLMPSAQAQAAEITPTDFAPLEVGNQWTYKHQYENYSSGWWWNQTPEIRIQIPAYPYDSDASIPDSLLWVERELTIEITHTEMVDGLEYFVFSHADYDWPPIPKLFWAGQQVRLSDEGVLLFRWNGQDVPLYDLNVQHPRSYSISTYPIREDVSTKLDISRRVGDDGQVIFDFLFPELPTIPDMIIFRNVFFLPRYGLSAYANEYYKEGSFDLGGGLIWEETTRFVINMLRPISAIISGEAVSYEQARRGGFDTHVQASSWGQLKRAFRPR